MHDIVEEIKKNNPEFIEKSFNIFAEKMPKLLLIMYEGDKYDCHIGTKEVAMLAKEYIVNNKDEYIGFHWTYEDVTNTAKNYIDFEKVDFYPCDLWVWANVKYGDMSHIVSEPSTILKYAISELSDKDFPYYAPDKRAYYWLKKHIENEERE